jgi:hypothetical protein
MLNSGTHVLSYALLSLLLACATRGESQAQKNVFWTVNLDVPQQIAIATGDMIRVKSPTFAVVPANLGKSFQIAYDHSRLSLIAEQPPDSDGRMGKQYFLLAVAPGPSQIIISVKDQDKLVEAVTLDVTCR